MIIIFLPNTNKKLIRILDILLKKLLKSGIKWNQAKAKFHKELGFSQDQTLKWKPHMIVDIDSEENSVTLKAETGKIIIIDSDKISTKNLIRGIYENRFLSKYGTDFLNEIKFLSFSYSRSNPSEFKVILITRLKPDFETTKKRKKMYHKRTVAVSGCFFKSLLEKTV